MNHGIGDASEEKKHALFCVCLCAGAFEMAQPV